MARGGVSQPQVEAGSQSLGRNHPPDHVADIVGDEERALAADGDADRPAERVSATPSPSASRTSVMRSALGTSAPA
jgi:hypothetical protein